MRTLFAMLLISIAAPLQAQSTKDRPVANGYYQVKPASDIAASDIANPFQTPVTLDDMDDMDGMDMDMGMDMGSMSMGDMSDPHGAPAAPTAEVVFNVRLQRAIEILKSSKDAGKKKALQGFIKDAFSQRYDQMMSARNQDITRLRKRLATLEADHQRRVAAKERVVQLQLQSVQLAAEGLLDLNDIQGVSGQATDEYGGRNRYIQPEFGRSELMN